jgi:hypothetical protein
MVNHFIEKHGATLFTRIQDAPCQPLAIVQLGDRLIDELFW